ncbi:unnamed protein product [Schistosoma turkestanicum]|nr:unnamed protein product [Schistosoma turkestanicum]
MSKQQSVCRKRTLSFADITDCRKSSRTNSNENHEIDSSKPFIRNMVRRPSFTFLEHQNLSHELPCLSEKPTLKDSNAQFKNARESTEMNASLKRNSNSQSALDSFISSASFIESNSANATLSAIQLSKMHSNSLGPMNSLPLKYEEYLSPSSPLSSTLIKLYLSKVSLCSSTEEILENNLNFNNEQVNLHNSYYIHQNFICLPGCLQIISYSLIASMIMPIRYFISINSITNGMISSNLKRLSSINENVKIHSFKSSSYSDTSKYTTDLNDSSSSTESSSSLIDDISNGYYSDNYLNNNNNEAVKPIKTNQVINHHWPTTTTTVQFQHQSNRFSLLSGGKITGTQCIRNNKKVFFPSLTFSHNLILLILLLF